MMYPKPEKTAKKPKKPIRKKGTGEISRLDEKLWKIFSEFIRRRDAKKFSGGEIAKCITCGKIDTWKNLQAGHFISRRFKATKFNEKNNNAQCYSCNMMSEGRQFEHGKAINRIYGEGTAEMILAESRKTVKYGAWEYQILIDLYKFKLSEL
jgi:hypothetical protein